MSGWEMPLSMREEVSTQKIGDELLLYNARTHKAFCLNATAAIVWELANGTRTLDELTTLASEALCVPLTRDLVTFILDELRLENLVQSAKAENNAPISRRRALQKLGIGCAALLPVIASIAAPTAAQAYSGCVDCSVQPGRPGPNTRRKARRPPQ